jgi:hypothetical protein
MEKYKKVIPYRVHKLCDKCFGKMISTGDAFYNNIESWFRHECNNCGDIQKFKKSYPYIEYIEDD